MKKILIIIPLIFLYSCGTQLFKKGPGNKNSISISLLCNKKEVGCKKMKTLDDKEIYVRAYPSLVLGVQSAQILKEPKKNELVFNLNIEPLGIGVLQSFSSSYQGKAAALIFDDEVLFYSTLFAPIKDGKLFFMMDTKKDKKTALNLCLSIDPNCPTEIKEIGKGKQTSSETLPFYDPRLISKHYGKVNQSHFWYSTYENIEIYSDKYLSNIPKTISNRKVQGGGLFASFFVGVQEFDENKKEYVFGKSAIKIKNLGWIKRSDLFPGNILRPTNSIISEMYSIGILSKCPSTLDYFVKISRRRQPNFNGKALSMVLKNKASFTQDSKTSLCAQLGNKFCQKKLKKLDDKIKSMECKDFETALNISNLEEKNEYQRMYGKCLKKNTSSCAILTEFHRMKKNNKKRDKLLKMACNYKNGESCFNLGLLLTAKKAIKSKKLQGMKFLKKACDLEFYPGCHQYSYLLFKQGRKKASIKPYEKACKYHQYQSCSNLGGMYLAQKKFKDAKRVLDKSCLFNNPTGCYNMACYWALNQDLQSSLITLKKSFMLGLPVDDWVKKKDPDLKFIRNTLEFKALLNEFSKKKKSKK